MAWKVSASGQVWIAENNGNKFLGNMQQVETFLDEQDNVRRQQVVEKIRMRRAKRRMTKLLNWLYNHNK